MIFWLIYYDKPAEQKRLSAEELAYIHSDEIKETAVGVTDATVAINTKQEKVAWLKLLGYNQTWAFTIGKFLTDGVWWFFLFWLPAYLKDGYGIVDEK